MVFGYKLRIKRLNFSSALKFSTYENTYRKENHSIHVILIGFIRLDLHSCHRKELIINYQPLFGIIISMIPNMDSKRFLRIMCHDDSAVKMDRLIWINKLKPHSNVKSKPSCNPSVVSYTINEFHFQLDKHVVNRKQHFLKGGQNQSWFVFHSHRCCSVNDQSSH